MDCTCEICKAPIAGFSRRDRLVSRRLDSLIVQLDSMPGQLRRRWLRLHKRALEAFVPAGGA